MINLNTYLILALFIFCLGLFTVFTRKNVIGILMGIELMLNAAALNFVAFNFFGKFKGLPGHIFALFIIVLAAAEAVVALALVLAFYQQRKSLDVENIRNLRG